MNKRYFIVSAITFVAVVFSVFLFGSGKTTFYVKNAAPRLQIAAINQKLYQAEDKIGDLSNNIIPEINAPENLTENFAGILAKAIIDKNNQPKNSSSPSEPGLNMPDPNKIAEEFIANGLTKANENILNIAPVQLKISTDNSKKAIEIYLAETQKILNDNLKGEPLISILEEINKNNGGGLEKLLPIISAHETAANQIEDKIAPSSVKDLMTEEVQLLRITANILRALTNIESDPLGGLAATKQFVAVVQNWANLQIKFINFTKKLNHSQ